jgi:hypothetical protein
MFALLWLMVSCRHHAGSDLVQAPAPPSDCAAWYDVDAPESACRGMDEPRPATMTTLPRLDSNHANCMLRCDQSRPRWEVDIQTAGFHGNVLCTIDSGPTLRLAIGAGAVSDGVHARWAEPTPERELATSGTAVQLRLHSTRCEDRPAPGSAN